MVESFIFYAGSVKRTYYNTNPDPQRKKNHHMGSFYFYSASTATVRKQVLHFHLCIFKRIKEGRMKSWAVGTQWRKEQKEQN